jgi:branched-chain amino acid transport system permease protein
MDFGALGNCLITPQCAVPRLLGGLASAAILYLVASGLSLIFGVMKVLNFAHGSLYMLGAYFGLSVVRTITGDAPTTTTAFVLALLVAPVMVAIAGAVMEAGFLRPIYDREILDQLLLTYAFVLILNDAVHWYYGSAFYTTRPPDVLLGTVSVVGRAFPIYQLFLIVLAVAVAVLLTLGVNRTRAGTMLRATALDDEMARAIGINVPRVWTAVFGIGAALGGLGGMLAGPLRSLYPGMALDLLVESFLVVVIGGLGSLAGAALGALLVGQFRAFGIIVAPGLELVFIYILVVVVLLTRPRGLMGRDISL